MSVIVPSSTCGRSASCWLLLKRWISSMNRTVEPPPWPIHCARRGDHARARRPRRSSPPRACAKGESTDSASSRASVVLPEPGGPHRTIEARWPPLDHAPQRATLADEVLLADELIERARAHPRRQGRVGGVTRTGRAPAGRRGGWSRGARSARHCASDHPTPVTLDRLTISRDAGDREPAYPRTHSPARPRPRRRRRDRWSTTAARSSAS